MSLTQEIIVHNFVSNAVVNICAVSSSIRSQASSFHPELCRTVEELWQNCANGTPGKVEMNISYAYIFEFQNHWICSW